jgi:hypothetical protein
MFIYMLTAAAMLRLALKVTLCIYSVIEKIKPQNHHHSYIRLHNNYGNPRKTPVQSMSEVTRKITELISF